MATRACAATRSLESAQWGHTALRGRRRQAPPPGRLRPSLASLATAQRPARPARRVPITARPAPGPGQRSGRAKEHPLLAQGAGGPSALPEAQAPTYGSDSPAAPSARASPSRACLRALGGLRAARGRSPPPPPPQAPSPLPRSPGCVPATRGRGRGHCARANMGAALVAPAQPRWWAYRAALAIFVTVFLAGALLAWPRAGAPAVPVPVPPVAALAWPPAEGVPPVDVYPLAGCGESVESSALDSLQLPAEIDASMPTSICIGAQKSGTTTLNWLMQSWPGRMKVRAAPRPQSCASVRPRPPRRHRDRSLNRGVPQGRPALTTSDGMCHLASDRACTGLSHRSRGALLGQDPLAAQKAVRKNTALRNPRPDPGGRGRRMHGRHVRAERSVQLLVGRPCRLHTRSVGSSQEGRRARARTLECAHAASCPVHAASHRRRVWNASRC